MTGNQPRLQAGGTLNPRRHVYVRRPQDERLLRLLLAGEYVNVLTPRQMGKSSLMVRTAFELQAHGVKTVIMDLASALGGSPDPEAYYLGLIGQIARSLKLGLDPGKWWRAHRDETYNQRLLRFFRGPLADGVEGAVVVFLDEIDSTLKLPFTDDLFTAIRGMYNERGLEPAYERIAFCLLGVAAPNELIKDRRTTPYNVGQTLELDDFDPALEDLTPITRALSDDPEMASRLLDRVLHWTGGHPFLTVKLCVDLREAGANNEADVNRHVEETYGRLERLSADVHFQQIRRFLTHRLTDSFAALDLYERILTGKPEPDRTTLTHAELKLSGLLKRGPEGLLVIRNPIYRRLFDVRWVAGSRPRRSLARYRQWAIAASVLLVVLIGGMGAFLWWANAHEYPPGTAAVGFLTRLGLWPVREPEMLQVPAGTFLIGSPDGEPDRFDDEGPVHEVTFARPFAIGKYEVTLAQYDQFAAATGRPLPNDQGWGRGQRPVIDVAWEDAVAYAAWLEAKTGKRFRLPTEAEWEYAARGGTRGDAYFWGDRFRLPTEAEWEYAARGGTLGDAYFWGDDGSIGCTYGNLQDQALGQELSNIPESFRKSEWWRPAPCNDGYGFQTAPVGLFKPNGLGLYDTAGNVWEWVQDCWHGNYEGAPDDGSAWGEDGGGDCGRRVVRGGSWINGPGPLRSAYRCRGGYDADCRGGRGGPLGIRLAQDR